MDAASITEQAEQYVELLPERTVMSAVKTASLFPARPDDTQGCISPTVFATGSLVTTPAGFCQQEGKIPVGLLGAI
jgi:hypothetical protein